MSAAVAGGPCRYEPLGRDELSRLAEACGGNRRFVVRAVHGSHELAALGRHVESVVFGEMFGNSPQLLADEYGPYEDDSWFVVVVDRYAAVPAGAMRIVVRDAVASLKSLADLSKPPWRQDPTAVLSRAGVSDRPGVRPGDSWDIATLAVMPTYRRLRSSALVSAALYQTSATIADARGVGFWVTILDERVFRLLQRSFVQPFRLWPGVAAEEYLGSSVSVPAWLSVPSLRDGLAEHKPELLATTFAHVPLHADHEPCPADDAAVFAAADLSALRR